MVLLEQYENVLTSLAQPYIFVGKMCENIIYAKIT
jgi:hypothetical protein